MANLKGPQTFFSVANLKALVKRHPNRCITFLIRNSFSQKLVRSGKSSKYEENEYKSSLGCLKQKPMGALNSTRIGGDFKPKKIQKFFLKNW